jgi:predicted negative regulator of RcsB-dependent stress response
MSHISDEEQIRLLKKWWRKYGTYVLVAMLISLASNYGWRYSQQYKARQASLASISYNQMLAELSQQKKDAAELFADNLQKKYRRTPYASLANLLMAKNAVKDGKLDMASQKLKWVIDHGKQKSFRQLARLRLARIFINDKKPEEALALLNTLEDKTFAGIASEIRGDALVMLGKEAEGVAAYKDALNFNHENGLNSPLLKIKLQQFDVQSN